MENTSAPGLAQQALAAFQRGEPATARKLLDAIAPAPDIHWLMVGQLEEGLGRESAADAAYVRHLAVAPRDLTALLRLGALRARSGDDRSANAFYRAALNVASQPGFRAPAQLVPMLQEGQRFVEAATQRFTAHIEAAVAGAGSTSAGRMQEAVDLLMGRKELYLQQPSMFYFPGLPQRAFYEREEFDWLPGIEAQTAAMREELEGLLGEPGCFSPYVQRDPDRPPPANPLLDDPSWGAQYLWKDGAPAEPAGSRCPVTMAALETAPIPRIRGRSPTALFSLLKPGTHIRPHHGLLNTRLICHIPLIAPPGCALRVGAHTREWFTGEALIFDDSFEHEAWNRGDSLRVVLLFEIWRPELHPEEREALTGIFEAIDRYQGIPADTGS